jgi:hypothetical protein
MSKFLSISFLLLSYFSALHASPSTILSTNTNSQIENAVSSVSEIENNDSNYVQKDDEEFVLPKSGYFEASIYPRTTFSAYTDLTQQDIIDKHYETKFKQQQQSQLYNEDDAKLNLINGYLEASIVAPDHSLGDVLDAKYKENLLWIANDPKKKKSTTLDWSHDSQNDTQQTALEGYVGHRHNSHDEETSTQKQETEETNETTKRFRTMNVNSNSNVQSTNSIKHRLQSRLRSLQF